jgi:hypothetical protein
MLTRVKVSKRKKRSYFNQSSSAGEMYNDSRR